jgi:hypothetical protein
VNEISVERSDVGCPSELLTHCSEKHLTVLINNIDEEHNIAISEVPQKLSFLLTFLESIFKILSTDTLIFGS